MTTLKRTISRSNPHAMYILVLVFACIQVNGETNGLRRSFIEQGEAGDDTRRAGQQEFKDTHSFQRRSLQEEEEDDTVHCRYIRGDVHYVDGGTEAFDACEDGNTLFDLAPEFLNGIDHHDLHSGRTRLDIKGAHERSTRLTNETDHIQATGTARPRVIVHDSFPLTRGLSTKTSNEIISSTGTKKLIIVRITSLDSEVTLSRQELSKSTFDDNSVSFATQMARCSNQKLQIVPARGTHIHDGVGELYLPEVTIGVAAKNLQTALREAFVQRFGSEDNFDFIAYCHPEGTGSPDRGWIAYAYRDTKFSHYNNDWCGSLTSRMHEIGHCMGVGHSGEGDLGYEDRSCVMGVSFLRQDGPQECFNGWRHYALDWYADRELSIDPVSSAGSWGGKLAAFVDYQDMKDGHYVIVNVRDVYLQYNLADKHNWEVGERADEITITQAKGDAEEPSSLLGGISTDSPTFEYKHNGDTLVFEVCNNVGKDGKVRFLKISIHERGKPSACTTDPQPTPVPPTPSPTPIPTKKLNPSPTKEPTVVVSLPPSPKRIKARSYGAATTELDPSSEEENSGTCVDSTLPFKVNTIDVTCENVAKDPKLKALYCNKGSIAYSECRKTCDSCGFIQSSGSTGLTSSTLRRTPLRPWNINNGGNWA